MKIIVTCSHNLEPSSVMSHIFSWIFSSWQLRSLFVIFYCPIFTNHLQYKSLQYYDWLQTHTGHRVVLVLSRSTYGQIAWSDICVSDSGDLASCLTHGSRGLTWQLVYSAARKGILTACSSVREYYRKKEDGAKTSSKGVAVWIHFLMTVCSRSPFHWKNISSVNVNGSVLGKMKENRVEAIH